MAEVVELLCQSCGKYIDNEPLSVVLSNKQLFSNRIKSQVFHKTPVDCANAREVNVIPLHNPKWRGKESE